MHKTLDYMFLMRNKYMRETQPQLKSFLEMPRCFPPQLGLVCPGKHHASDHFSLVYELQLAFDTQVKEEEDEIVVNVPYRRPVMTFEQPIDRPEPLNLRAIDQLDSVPLPHVEFVSDQVCELKNEAGNVLMRLEISEESTYSDFTEAIVVQTNRFMMGPEQLNLGQKGAPPISYQAMCAQMLGGYPIIQQCKNWLDQHGEVSVGRCAYTFATNELTRSCRYLLHTVGPIYTQDRRDMNTKQLKMCVYSSLSMA